ncbi:tetratricopeptide repeat protein [Aquitalea denitrificans]|uniref:tetratricopeptide repeat protein n=1 Tax=Aquitalea denitrificans TaxID=519081 RepID=UPI00135C07C8|nr:tetratricopeptide repeat protein [Aquitalea denitrificans]
MLLSPLALRAATLLAEQDLPAALQAAQQCLEAEPDNAPIWTLLGVCAARLARQSLAEQCWQQALQLDPSVVDAHYNLGCLYGERRERGLAEQHYRAELRLQPGHAGSLGNLAVLLAQAGQLAEAEACYRQALQATAHTRDGLDVRYNLALLLSQTDRLEEAEALLQVLLQQQPDDEAGNALLGSLYQQQGQDEAARACWERILQHAPQHPEALNNLALICQQQRRWDEAASLLQRALLQAAPPPDLLLNQANGLLQQGNAAAALPLLQQAIAQHPRHAPLHDALGVVCSELREAEQAEAAMRRAVELAPGQPRFRQNLAYLHLALGRWSAGWEALDARLQRLPLRGGLPTLSSPRWEGEPLAGRHLLLWFEQGLGDALQFCRYLPLLQPARLSVVCRPELIRLLQGMRLACPVEFLPLHRLDMTVPPHDCHVFSMSLPRWLGPDPATTPPAHFPQHARPPLPSAGRPRRLGLVWRGHARHPFDHHRSLPDIRLLAPLLALPGIHWISLQLPVDEQEQAWLSAWPTLVAGEQGLDDLAATASVLAGLDGLVTVDTALAHLAGSLGLPCWLLLSACHTDWRWGWQGEASPWYPAVRLCRQSQPGDWSGVITRLASRLGEQ